VATRGENVPVLGGRDPAGREGRDFVFQVEALRGTTTARFPVRLLFARGEDVMTLMTHDNGSNGSGQAAGGFVGAAWFIGWLFTWAFAKLVWWEIIVGIVIWPYFLGVAAR
jgi:hypothetical protein